MLGDECFLPPCARQLCICSQAAAATQLKKHRNVVYLQTTWPVLQIAAQQCTAWACRGYAMRHTAPPPAVRGAPEAETSKHKRTSRHCGGTARGAQILRAICSLSATSRQHCAHRRAPAATNATSAQADRRRCRAHAHVLNPHIHCLVSATHAALLMHAPTRQLASSQASANKKSAGSWIFLPTSKAGSPR